MGKTFEKTGKYTTLCYFCNKYKGNDIRRDH